MEDVELKIIDLIASYPFQSVSSISAMLPLSYRKTYHVVRKLQEKGVLVREGDVLVLQPIFGENINTFGSVMLKLMDSLKLPPDLEPQDLINIISYGVKYCLFKYSRNNNSK